MDNKVDRPSGIGESLPSFEVDGSIEYIPTDAEINRAYNIFDAEKLKYYRNVMASLHRDFTKRKDRHPKEWNDFMSVVRMCKANRFNLGCYIKYCFLNRLVPKARGKMLGDVSYLNNTPQLIDYARNKTEIERLFAVYRSIQRTIILVKRMIGENGGTPKTVIKDILSSGKLSHYVTTGMVSPYFISLIPKASQLVHTLMDRYEEDCTELMDLCNRMEIYGKDAQKSMSMFYPNAMSKTILELCA